MGNYDSTTFAHCNLWRLHCAEMLLPTQRLKADRLYPHPSNQSLGVKVRGTSQADHVLLSG